MNVPSALVLRCESCGEETRHRVLHGRLGGKGDLTFQGTVKCSQCGTVRSVTHQEPRPVSIEIMVSWMAATERHTLELAENTTLAVGDRLAAAGGTVEITNLEVAGRRVGSALAGKVDTAWARRVDQVRLKVSTVRGARTTSKNLFASPDEEFEVGEILEIGRERLLVWRIQLVGKTLTAGTAPAEKVVKLLCKPVRQTTRR